MHALQAFNRRSYLQQGIYIDDWTWLRDSGMLGQAPWAVGDAGKALDLDAEMLELDPLQRRRDHAHSVTARVSPTVMMVGVDALSMIQSQGN